MAQGKLKVRAKNKSVAAAAGASNRKSGVRQGKVRKGKKVIAPKKQHQAQVAKFGKEIQKNINSKIEAELCQRAKHVEEGRGFRCIDQSSGGSSSSSKVKAAAKN